MVRTATPFQDSSSDERSTEQVKEPTSKGKQKQKQGRVQELGRHDIREPVAKVVIGTRRKRSTERVDELPPHGNARLGQGPSKRPKMPAQAMFRSLK